MPYIKNPGHITVDATCYESEIRYPTNVKLLWESVDWVAGQSWLLHKYLNLKQPRSKYNKWKTRYIIYSKKRRKSKKERVALTRGLLNLLDKFIKILDDVTSSNEIELSDKYYKRIETIKEIYRQQYNLLPQEKNRKTG